MPVVIKELLIKAIVTKPAGERSSVMNGLFNLEKLKKEIKRECIDEVMEKIREQKER
jgi:predicted RecA/RadA family phage recombinase